MTCRFDFIAGMASLLAMFFAGSLEAQTPFSFIHRDDVREEVNVSQTQINRVDQLQVHCDALCQQRMRETISSMEPDLQQQFEQLDLDQRQTALTALEQDMLDTVQLEALDEQVLNDPQMDRFEQLWTQQNGLDSLTCGPSSRQLGMSNIQISQIQTLRDGASVAMQACSQNSQLSLQQQFIQIQNIQINLINQCVNILSDEQVLEFANMCGDPFDADPIDTGPTDQAPTIGDEGIDNSSITSESQDSDATNSVGNDTSSFAGQTGEGQESRSRRRGQATNRNSTSPRRGTRAGR